MHDSAAVSWTETVLARLAEPPEGRLCVGCDGFFDRIVRVVAPHEEQRIVYYAQIAAFLESVPKEASSAYELVLQEQRLGGNAPLLARGAAQLGLPTTLIATLGWPQPQPSLIATLQHLPLTLLSIGRPGETLALEFDNGKIMLGQMEELSTLRLDDLEARLAPQSLIELVRSSSMMAWVNWTMTGWLEDLWREMLSWNIPLPPMLVDLADPTRRGGAALERVLTLLSSWPGELLLGMNRNEAQHVARLGSSSVGGTLSSLAETCGKLLPGATLLLHSREEALLHQESTQVILNIPTLKTPRTMTGAGDHFNAGICLGRSYGLSGQALLGMGAAYATAYVMNGASPSREQLRSLLREQQAAWDTPPLRS